MTSTPKLRQILENETNSTWKNNQIKFLQELEDDCVFKSSGDSAHTATDQMGKVRGHLIGPGGTFEKLTHILQLVSDRKGWSYSANNGSSVSAERAGAFSRTPGHTALSQR